MNSPSDNEDNATDTKAHEGIPKANTCEEVTSPSSESPSLVPVNDDVGAHARPSKRRKYIIRRKRTGPPSIPMQGIHTNKLVVVCHKAALFLIGVSAQRVQGVLEGQEYVGKEWNKVA